MRLTPDVALVGGGPLTGFGLSGDLDAHIYLIDGGDEAALVDCGMGAPASMDRILANIASDGVDADRVRGLLLTHYHTDHAGGAARFRERLRAEVAIGAVAAAALETGDHAATQFDAGQRAGLFPPGYAYSPCTVDRALEDGDVIEVGGLSVRYIATPGHCAGHGAFLVTGGATSCLLSGDALFARGRVLLQAIPDCDLEASLESVRRLAGERFDALLPGHGSIALTGGHAHAELALARIDSLSLPANYA